MYVCKIDKSPAANKARWDMTLLREDTAFEAFQSQQRIRKPIKQQVTAFDKSPINLATNDRNLATHHGTGNVNDLRLSTYNL